MNHKEWQKKKQENHGENARTQETKKIYLPAGGMVKVTHDKQHRPDIEIFEGESNTQQQPKNNNTKHKKQHTKDIFDINDDLFGFQ